MQACRISLVLVALIIVPLASATCPLASTNLTVNICAPTSGSTVDSPFTVSASANDTNPVVAMKIYLDFNSTAVYAVSNTNQLSTTLSAVVGQHHITVKAWDSTTSFSSGFYFNVGSSTASGSVSVSPTSVSFGDVIVNTTSASQTVTLSNGTASAITINSIGTAAPFAQTNNCGGSLSANTSCQITVTFTPSATGAQNGSLTINESAGTINVPLSGSGVTVSAITVTPADPTITVGQTQQFTATATFSDNTQGNITSQVMWTSSDAAVATINATGLATAVAQGTSTIEAAYGAVNNSTVLSVNPASTGVAGVYTFHYDNLRTGANSRETTLTTSNVNVNTFGKKCSYSVDGHIFAQPLYMANQSIGGGTHNVVFVATEHDSVYAFDANCTTSTPYWHRNFLGTNITTIPQANVGSTIYPEVGITGTPVIDPSSGTIYVVAGTIESGVYTWKLHALSTTSGADKFGGFVVVSATGFGAKYQLQRPGLLLANGNVYFAFGSEGDNSSWHGWVFGYNASTLLKVGAYNNTPTGNGGGIWQAGGGLGADGTGNIYFETGNGSNNIATGGSNLADSFIKLNGSLQRVDYFSPFNHSNMDCCDLDLASGGPVLLPDQSVGATHVMIGGGKTNSLYVVNRDNLGGFSSNANNVIQTINGAVGAIYSQPSFWNGRMYIVASSDYPKMFTFSNGVLSSKAVSQGTFTFAFPGANTTISANGTSNGIVWAQDKNGILHAFSAANLATELWNSNQNSTRDALGTASRFAVPLVVNGEVYVGTSSNKLVIYGVL